MKIERLFCGFVFASNVILASCGRVQWKLQDAPQSDECRVMAGLEYGAFREAKANARVGAVMSAGSFIAGMPERLAIAKSQGVDDEDIASAFVVFQILDRDNSDGEMVTSSPSELVQFLTHFGAEGFVRESADEEFEAIVVATDCEDSAIIEHALRQNYWTQWEGRRFIWTRPASAQ